MRDNGKGDKRRPLVIPEEQFNANWDSIFDKRLTKEDAPYQKPAPKELADEIDKALGIKR
jgi:hypothetical protein